ncbi:MAG: ankyrin repeat protein [Rubritalea sp.]|jgi:ankyrin repeat protein
MKKLLTLSVLFISTLSYGQREMAEALKSDHVTLLNQNINESNKNNCLEIKGSEYNLLSIAIKMDSKKVFEALISKHSVDLDKICEDKTPLMYAIKYGREDMVSELLSAGANLDKKSRKGKTAIYYAEKYDQKSILKILNGFKR